MKTWEEAVVWLRDNPENKDLVLACYYDDPLIDAANRFYDSIEWVETKMLFGKPGLALDIGAGRGIASFALAKDGWDVFSLEPDTSNIVGSGAIKDLARQSGYKIQVNESWGEELPYADNFFDLVYARQVLHHANDLNKLCSEIYRVLKPGGMLIAAREHVLSKREDLEAFLNSHPLHKLYGGEHAYLLGEYISAIESAGMKINKVLKPYTSNINLFPQSAEQIIELVSEKIKLPVPVFSHKIVLKLLDLFNNTPGRLFTFVAEKK